MTTEAGSETEPETTAVAEDVPEPDSVTDTLKDENAELRAALAAHGVDDIDKFLEESVTYRRDGTPVVAVPVAAVTESDTKTTTRSARPSVRKRGTAPTVKQAAKIDLNPTGGNVNAADVYKTANELARMKPADRAAVINNARIRVR